MMILKMNSNHFKGCYYTIWALAQASQTYFWISGEVGRENGTPIEIKLNKEKEERRERIELERARERERYERQDGGIEGWRNGGMEEDER